MASEPMKSWSGFDQSQIVAMLRSEIKERGDQLALAKRIGISPQWLTDILKSQRSPTGRVLSYLGLKRVPVYVPETDASHGKTPDPIDAAVDAQMAGLGDQVKAFGHQLAKAVPAEKESD